MRIVSDISVTPDFTGLPPNLYHGLIHLTNNAAAVLTLVAGLGLLAYAVLLFAMVKLIPITLTLPGIAGLILTLGVAADANIVIFERIKEEARSGRSIPAAIAGGYAKGIRTIVDANVVTIGVAFILFMLATVCESHDDGEDHRRRADHGGTDQYRLRRRLERVACAVILFEQILGALELRVEAILGQVGRIGVPEAVRLEVLGEAELVSIGPKAHPDVAG